jgi:hydroxymethylpyrimidine pyrophosphatase-like HAD family hydrolase
MKMKITLRFKEQLRKAKKQGYKNVFVSLGNYKATRYVALHSIDTLLAQSDGAVVYSSRRTPGTGRLNERHLNFDTDIQYTRVFHIN